MTQSHQPQSLEPQPANPQPHQPQSLEPQSHQPQPPFEYRAVLSIGSNMDDKLGQLQSVYDHVVQAPDIALVAASPIYATPPWGEENQDEFLNAVLIVDTSLAPRELLDRGQRLEAAADRVRIKKWGPRTLDVDIVQVTDLATSTEVLSDDPVLTLPHPHAHERAFVLLPWVSIDDHAQLDGHLVIDHLAGLPHADVEAIREVGAFAQASPDAQPPADPDAQSAAGFEAKLPAGLDSQPPAGPEGQPPKEEEHER